MSACRWVRRFAGHSLPENAVVGGYDIDNATIYVGRVSHEGDMIPAKVIPSKNVAYICHAGQEHAKHEFEVMCCDNYAWESCRDDQIPGYAVVAGETSDGESLYVGRVFYNGSQTVGKVQRSHRCLYIPFDGVELSFPKYEILVPN